MKIIFMGTPEFSAVNLEGLINSNYEIEAVFTQADKPQGRKMILTAPPVKEVALKYNIPVYQPTTLRSDEIINKIKEINPDLIVVVAYGKILPKAILDIPKFGCINVHGSLLPKYRGASPIQTAILNGESITGITTMYMDEGMDTGDMILKKEVKIEISDTSDSLYEKLAIVGKDLLIETVGLIEKGVAPREKQQGEASYCKILKKEDGLIDWNKNAIEINNLIRAFNSWPCAFTVINGKTYKIWKANVLEENAKPGEIVCADMKQGLKIGTGNGILEIVEIQAEGKKRMKAEEFLRGNKM